MKLNGNTLTSNTTIEAATIAAPEKSNQDKITAITFHFQKIMEALELDLNDPSLKDTPKRVAKMYVNEAFKGLDNANFPAISLFDNEYLYDEMISVNDITLYSYCEHHFVPFMGKVHVAYFPNKKVIGLSKINRLVEFISKKPQVQEKLTVEIANTLSAVLDTQDVAVYVEANHLCVASRGIKDTKSITKTGIYLGKFEKQKVRKEFFNSFK